MTKEELFKENPKIKAIYKMFLKYDVKNAETYLQNVLIKYQSKSSKSSNFNKEKLTLEEISKKPKNKNRIIPKPKPQITRKRSLNLMFTHPETKETKHITEWAKQAGIAKQTFQQRYAYYGNIPAIYLPTDEFSLNSPSAVKANMIKNIAQKYNISIPTARYRFKIYGLPDTWPSNLLHTDKQQTTNNQQIISDIAEQYGISQQAAYYRYHRYGLPDNWPDYLRNTNSRYKQQIVYDIASQYPHVSLEAIRHRYKKYGLPQDWPEHLK